MIKDRLFLFDDYQGVRENQPLNAEIITVPTAKMRTGDFTELLGQGTTQARQFCKPATVVNGGTYDPLTCAQFPGNIIAADRQNAAGVKYLNAYPLPNIPGTNNGTGSNTARSAATSATSTPSMPGWTTTSSRTFSATRCMGRALPKGMSHCSRRFQSRERLKTELRTEVFNVTNTPQFTNPDGNPGDGNFGKVTGTRNYSEGQMQMAFASFSSLYR